jgi:hypothetical protein
LAEELASAELLEPDVLDASELFEVEELVELLLPVKFCKAAITAEASCCCSVAVLELLSPEEAAAALAELLAVELLGGWAPLFSSC